MRIPRKIHFIWAGGDTQMPESYETSVHLWHQQNPSFEIWMWIDKKSSINPEFCSDSDDSYYKKTFGNIVQLKDIEEENIADEYIRYEIEKPKPNYGASSDLLRYKILFEYGGAYFDFDITPGNLPLANSSIFNKNFGDRHVLFTHKSQNTDFEGNDAFICTLKNPQIFDMYKTAINHYTLRYNEILIEAEKELFSIMEFNSPDKMAYYYEDKNYIRDSTIVKTGPLCTRLVTKNSPHHLSLEKNCCNLFKYKQTFQVISNMNEQPPTYFCSRNTRITVPFKINGNLWIENKVFEIKLHELVCRINNTIKFEVEKLGILRLDDHVTHIKKLILDNPELFESFDINVNICSEFEIISRVEIKALSYIARMLENFNLSDLLSVQLTFKYQGTIDFCFNKQLLEKTFLFPLSVRCSELVNIVPYSKLALHAVMRIDNYSEFLVNYDNPKFNLNKLSSEIKNDINYGCNFLAYIADFSVFFSQQSIDIDLVSFDIYFEEIINNINFILMKLTIMQAKINLPSFNDSIIEFKFWNKTFSSFKSNIADLFRKNRRLEMEPCVSPYSLFYQHKITNFETKNKVLNDDFFSNSEYKVS